jgi:hypothetical protein
MEIPIHKIAELPREEVITTLLNFPGTFKFDFTREYLQGLETDQLRHMLLAAYLHASRDPSASCDSNTQTNRTKFAS